MNAARKGIFSHGRHLYGIMKNTLEQALNCEKAWDEYCSGIATSMSGLTSTSRFVRINPNIGKIPALDEKDKMREMRAKANQSLRIELEPQIKQIARQLVASSFYFELQSTSDTKPDGTANVYGTSVRYPYQEICAKRSCVLGRIHCRLLEDSLEMREFGKHIRRRVYDNEHLQFIALQDGDTNPLATLPLTDKTTRSMIQNGVFHIDRLRFIIPNRLLPTHINMCFGENRMYPISGFPRLIIQDDEHAISSTTMYSPSVSVSRRYTHGSRRLKRNHGKWRAPDIREAPVFSNLYEYANNPQRTLGHHFMNSSVMQTRLITSQTQRSADASQEPVKKGGIRKAFKALMWPIPYSKTEEDEEEYTNSIESWVKDMSGGSAPDYDSDTDTDTVMCELDSFQLPSELPTRYQYKYS